MADPAVPTNASSSSSSSSSSAARARDSSLPRPIPEGYGFVTENSATVIHKDQSEVFYNRVQETNRDLSILVIKTFMKRFQKERQQAKGRARRELVIARSPVTTGPTAPSVEPDLEKELPNDMMILEALAATGLRSIRYWNEIGGEHIDKLVVNDLEPAAVEAIRRNIEFNGLPLDRVVPHLGNAVHVMQQHPKHFHVVDLDPYGTAAPFMDGAVQSVRDGGLLCVTCTDAAVLCGSYAEVAYANYGSFSLRNSSYTHEAGLRIILRALESHAIRHKRYIVPLVSLSIDFYMRVFVRVFSSADEMKKSATKTSHVFQCVRCDSFYLQPLATPAAAGSSKSPSLARVGVPHQCPTCDGHFRMGGPIWHNPFYDPEFVQELLTELETHADDYGASDRVGALLNVLTSELPDSPLFMDMSHMCRVVHSPVPPKIKAISAIRNAGFKCSLSHTNPLALKTDAPIEFLWDIIRTWAKTQDIRFRSDGDPARVILGKEPTHPIDLKIRQDIVQEQKDTLAGSTFKRFPDNPQANWGPGSRAHAGHKRKVSDAGEQEATTRDTKKGKSEEDKEE